MKYLSIKNKATETAPDITGDMNHDETTIEQHTMIKLAKFFGYTIHCLECYNTSDHKT